MKRSSGISTSSGGVKAEELFPTGSRVEVSSDDDGFRDAWYVATVLHPPSTPNHIKRRRRSSDNSDKFLVQYETLLADEGSKEPLTEYVGRSFVRPLSMHDDSEYEFKRYDVVEAAHRDGWWTGVVTKVVEGGSASRYVVYFKNPPDEIEFRRSDLRVHRDWVDREWVRPQNQGTIGVLFSTGTAVEVSFDGQHSRDTWHLATVLRETGKNTFLVEYQNLGTGDETETTVDSHHIRPCPPRLEDKEFVLLEKVDAFYDYGWWSGNIVKILEDRSHIGLSGLKWCHSFLLSHASTDLPLIFPLPVNVVYGKMTLMEVEVPLSDSQEHTGMAISLITPAFLTPDLNEIEQSPPCNEKPPSHRMTSTLKKLRQEASDSDYIRVLKKLSEGNATQATLPVTPTPASARAELSGFAAFATHATGDTGTAWSRRAMMASERTKSPLGREVVSQISCSELWFIVNPLLASGTPVIETMQQKVGLLENEAPIVCRSKRSAKRPHARPIRKGKSQVERSVSSAKGKDGDVMGYGAEERVERECINGEVGMSVNLVAENPNHLLGKDHKASLMFMMNQKLQLINPVVEVIKGGESIQSMKREGVQELPVEKTICSMEGRHHGAGSAPDQMVVVECETNEAVAQTPVVKFSRKEGSPNKYHFQLSREYLKLPSDDDKLLSCLHKHKDSILKMSLGKKDKQPNQGEERGRFRRINENLSKRQGRRSTILEIVPLIQDSQDAIREEPYEVVEAVEKENSEKINDEMPSDIFDDQPLLTWLEGMQGHTNIDDSRVLSVRNVDLSDRGDDVAVSSPLIASSDDGLNKNQSLPFLKCSPLWKAIESMEVYKKMPQMPHFSSFRECKDESREGLAISCMVTFATVVEKASNLQFSSPRTNIDSYLETLGQLEVHGFNVEAVRARLNEMLSNKDVGGQLKTESKEVETHIMAHTVEKADLEKQINRINEQMRQLKEKLVLATTSKEIKDAEIATLESKRDFLREGILSAQRHFERLAASPW
ncbi:hypothetical protein RJ639_004069 [Escallonia herrerae]|uniref:Agenet domain-containing protein n=1 Tax=Escallonia herrerae TaxID=1293975 RepID=A0AA89AWV5_9ASTE|nr:hypothetical protein RJ639_004069 [Escallonia herrerae]